jgi:hypothetical protein
MTKETLKKIEDSIMNEYCYKLALDNMQRAIRQVTPALLAEGVDDNEIKAFFEGLVSSAVDDVVDPL